MIGIEAQERIFYALAGNVALNNCFNARVLNLALSDTQQPINIPVPDYCSAGSFGSLELRETSHNEYIGQTINYSSDSLTEVACQTIDSFNLPRLDLLKIDVEGMEIEVLKGARESLQTLNPVIFIEYIKVGHEKLARYFAELDYVTLQIGINLIALHKNDPLIENFAPNLQKIMREQQV
ncbi:FkbM family methyltransferase [Acetobacter pasteurianus]|uniref:FkbM family methyltransferase n=1 Tax=Acetobacter pasteurianus TaxID=438 RepID=UPI003D0E7BB3